MHASHINMDPYPARFSTSFRIWIPMKISHWTFQNWCKPDVRQSPLARKPSRRIWFGFLLKNFTNCLLKMQLRAGLVTVELTFRQYCEASFLRLKSRRISFASICKLIAGDVRKAPRQRHRGWFGLVPTYEDRICEQNHTRQCRNQV